MQQKVNFTCCCQILWILALTVIINVSIVSYFVSNDVLKLSFESSVQTKHMKRNATREKVICGIPGKPCEITDRYNFRIVVITHSRSLSLNRTLQSLQNLHLDGDTAMLDIWIDAIGPGKYSENVLQTIKAFHWRKGKQRLNRWKDNVGIIGNWIDSWRPPASCKDWISCREIALILEDDLDLSPMAYRWLKAAAHFYNNRSDVMGLTLTDVPPKIVQGVGTIQAPPSEAAFLYKFMGTWGFAPNPKKWRQFQDWFHAATLDSWHLKRGYKPTKSNYKPYVPNTLPDSWYKSFEKQGRAHSMWEMWLIHYMHITDTYCLYYNLRTKLRAMNVSLSVNRYSGGLHFSGSEVGQPRDHELLRTWKPSYIAFNPKPLKYAFNGSLVK